MKLQLIAVGTKMPTWVTSAFQQYAVRFPKEMPFDLIEVPAGKRTKNADVSRILNKEGEIMLAHCNSNDRIIALDIPGKPWSTHDLALQIELWKKTGQNVSFLIGGPEGLAPSCKKRAHQSWSLSPLTLPHPLVRVIVVESLYRAYTLTCNHPYHRE